MKRSLAVVVSALVAGGVSLAAAAPAAAVVRFEANFATEADCLNAAAQAGQEGYPAFCQRANQLPGYNLFVEDWG
ncbi:hypothetical protein ACFOVU_07970 [Nocardiopsis sediminis]|uniref:Uncharacterized protein n=1 Tax=Nocardiopsis sediminis TaxID=1778267 RepID=A0ABV8FI71_9ACTN